MSSTSTLPEPGDTVAGKYRLEVMLGRGGMSVVYGAVHRVTGRRFAIKFLLPEISANPDAARRFVRESQVSGRLQHPNVVEIFDIGEDIGSHYMVMEWLEGESLADRIERAGPLSLQEVTTLLLPCMRGVAAAHAAGIVHRDLKPANIFICAAKRERVEHAKVLDFGISKLSSSLELTSSVTHTGVVMGTPHYMSPEQMQGQPVDARTDVYAFGVILYQVLSSRLPFPAKTYGELVLQIATGHPEPLADLAPWLPAGVAPLVSRAMAREPRDRFASVVALIEAIEIACPTRASAYSISGPSARPSERSPSTPWSTSPRTQPQRLSRAPAHRSRMGLYAAITALFLIGTLLLLRGSRHDNAAVAPGPHALTNERPATVAESLHAQPPAPAPPTPPAAKPPLAATTPAAMPSGSNVATEQARDDNDQPGGDVITTARNKRHHWGPAKHPKARGPRSAAPVDDTPSRVEPTPVRKLDEEDDPLERNPLQMHIQ